MKFSASNDSTPQCFGDLLVCIPTHNEHEGIVPLIQKLRGLECDFLVVDGFSTDETVSRATDAGAKVMMRKTAGKAAAVKLGLKTAIERGKQYLALIDGDGSYDPEAFREMMPLLVNAQMVVGCRPYSKIAYSRRLANHLMNLLVLILYGQKVKDMASGLRILEVSAFEPYFDAVGFNVEPQLCCLAIKNRYDVKQVDINYFPRIGKSKSNPIHVLLACIEIVRIRFLYQSQP